MTSIRADFKNSIQEVITVLMSHADFAKACECDNSVIDVYLTTIEILSDLIKISESHDLKENYLNQLSASALKLFRFLPLEDTKDISFLLEDRKEETAHILKMHCISIKDLQSHLIFNINFFKKVNFFANNIVAIGANGSGKTSLARLLKIYLQENGIVISAQRILLIPNFTSIANPTVTSKKLRQEQVRDKDTRDGNEYNYLQSEFAVVLSHLLADNNAQSIEYRNKALEAVTNGKQIEPPSPTNLDKAFKIWNSLITHRHIKCDDGINIHVSVSIKDKESYSALRMSDGEKVVLYLIAQILQAPANGFIVIDEPEMYLHKTILKKLWNELESMRSDCLFIYLTHDLDFAASRTSAKKIWIKSFDYPDKWQIETIPDNEIPEAVMLEILGSRKNILFCEGERGSIDEKIYNILFPNFTITPVGGCFEVINHTKAFNKIPNLLTKAYGLVDADHHPPERLTALEKDNIYSFGVSEVENLLLDEQLLDVLAAKLMKGKNEISAIKNDIITDLGGEIDRQATHHVNAKIDYYFKDSHVSKSNTKDELNSNCKDFLDHIKIDEWHKERSEIIADIVKKTEYSKAIKIYNNKGLKRHAQKHLKITDFTDRAFELLQSNPETHEFFRKYFPSPINQAGMALNNSKI